MQLPDVNIILNAFRKDGSHHAQCKGWLNRTLAGSAAFAISTLSLAALIRISTNQRLYVHPSKVSDAVAFADGILGSPLCVRLEPGSKHWPIYTTLLRQSGITGPQTTDVWFAALAVEWNCEWITLDRGFSRFEGLRCREP